MRLGVCSLLLLWSSLAWGRYPLCTAQGSNAASGAILSCDGTNQGAWITTTTSTTTTTTSTTTTSTTTTTTSTTTTTTFFFFGGRALGWIASQGPTGALNNVLIPGRVNCTPGPSTAPDAAGVAWLNWGTSTSANTNAGICATTHQDARMDISSVHDWVIATGTLSTDIQNMRIWVSLASVNSSGGTRNADTQTVDWVGLLASSGLSANWQAYAGNASTNTTMDTGVAYAANTTYNLRIVMKLTSIDYYVNGSGPTTITTHLPSTANSLSGQVIIWTLNTTAKNIRTLMYTDYWPQ